MHEAILRVEPGGPYGEPTGGTDATVELWCNDHCDLLSVTGDERDEVLSTIEDRVGLRDRVDRADRTLAISDACLRTEKGTVERYLESHGCLLVPPIEYARGAKICRVLALDPSDLSALYRDLSADRRVTVESKRSIDDPPVADPVSILADPVPSLSSRQRETVRLAYETGYYELPRTTTTADLGDALGVSRRTAEEHLRRAERKIVGAVAERFVGGR
ncbi:helix-turn-helix domain-containing protein [Halovivax gelatinilyticus]|uniref:helix-turn-helix domain-containing protein n=1 Tax=Halovivax gelatinilyticus TaxID=2961597 RepID=UPI0020CA93E7|nr:helix-turn-helix domain-containing protein [Halovivax gelatinilyticus]